MTWDIRQGHVLDLLRAMPAELVHLVCTSPPYFGLRAYKTEPQVWGGVGGCGHEWGGDQVRTKGGPAQNKGLHNADGYREARDSEAQIVHEETFCTRCGAWCGELGSEPTIELYVEHIVEVFREVRRVLRRDGTCWLNLGDSYAGSGKGPAGGTGINSKQSYWSQDTSGVLRSPFGAPRKSSAQGADVGGWTSRSSEVRSPFVKELKPKDLALIPFRLALALQAEGWWVRSDIAWCKRAPMPESVRDRPTSAWEHLFLLSKSARYYYDTDAVREPYSESSLQRLSQPTFDQQAGGGKDPHTGNRSARKALDNLRTRLVYQQDWADRQEGWPAAAERLGGANMRNYWLLGPEPFSDAHFAVFPTEIPKRAILAGTSGHGCCPKCGVPWRRVVGRFRIHNGERAAALGAWHTTDPGEPVTAQGDGPWRYGSVSEQRGWEPTCSCPPAIPVPCVVLDPFVGSGTTVLVADRLGRHGIGLELNPDYVEMARSRITQDAPLFA